MAGALVWAVDSTRTALRNKQLAERNAEEAVKETRRAVAAERAAEVDKTRAVAAERAAEAEKTVAQRTLYGLRIGLCRQAWEHSELDRAGGLLDDQLPQPGLEDFRGFEWYYWWDRCHHGELVSGGHRWEVRSLAFSPDGKTLAVASWQDRPRVWDVATGLEKPGPIQRGMNTDSVAFSPDGKTIAWSGWDHLWLWRQPAAPEKGPLLSGSGHRIAIAPDGKELAWGSVNRWATLALPGGKESREVPTPRGAHALAYSPDGSLLATGDYGGAVTFWDAKERRPRSRLALHAGGVESLAFSPDGKTLASCGRDKLIKLVDVAGPAEKAVYHGHEGTVTSVAFSPDGKTLASASADRLIKLWDVTGGMERSTLRRHYRTVKAVAFSPDGRTLASGGSDQRVVLRDPTSEQDVSLPAQRGSIALLKFSHDGRTLATAHRGESGSGIQWRGAKLWDSGTGRERRQLAGISGVRSRGGAATDPEGKLMALSVRGAVQLWDLDARDRLADFPWGDGIFSPDGATLAVEGLKEVGLYDVATRRALGTVRGTSSGFIPIKFSADGKLLVTGGWGKPVEIWDARTAARIGELEVNPKAKFNNVAALEFSPDGRTMAVGYFGDDLELWDLATLRVVSRQNIRKKRSIVLLVFSPDGKTLATASGEINGSFNLSVVLWDLPRLTFRARLDDKAVTFDASAFSPDGKTLLLTDGFRVPRLWDVTTGRERGAFKGHIGRVNDQVFSPDGRRLTTADDDGRVIIWDAGSFQEIASFEGTSGPVTDIAYSRDRRRLAAAYRDGTVKILAAATDSEVVAYYERKARLAPDDIPAQVNLARACWGFHLHHDGSNAESRDEARRRLEQGRDILIRLRDAKRLDESQTGWIEWFETALERPTSDRMAGAAR
jgi:WD40 repeat protein